MPALHHGADPAGHHFKDVVTSSISEDEKAQYLRHMLMLKTGFLEHGERLGALSTAELQEAIQNAICHGDLRRDGTAAPRDSSPNPP